MKYTLLFVLIAVAMSTHYFLDQEEIIEEANKIQKSWVAGHNSYFDGKTIEEIKGLMGTKLDTPQELKLPLKDIQPLKDIPTEFFSATNWPKCQSIKQVRDQSTCGSCWAFSSVQAMSDRICIASAQVLQIRISAQQILTCCGSKCGEGCKGGYPSGAWIYFKRYGIVTGGNYNDEKWCLPYSFPPCDHHVSGRYNPCGAIQPTPKCVQKCVNNATFDNDSWTGDFIYGVSSTIQKIQTQIMTYGPVQAAFTVYNDFLTYKSGVYHHTSGEELGGHSVKIVGWGVQNNIPYWLAVNSWNEDWGDKGFFKIKRGSNQCGIQYQIHAGIPILKTNITLKFQ